MPRACYASAGLPAHPGERQGPPRRFLAGFGARAMEEQWTFMTNHGHVLLCIAADPAVRLRDVAARVGITERAAQRIVADLCDSGYLTRMRTGRRNHYEMHPELPFRHRCHAEADLGTLLDLADAPRPAPAERTAQALPLARTRSWRAHPA